MGVGCSCQKVESEEETVIRIFSNMNLASVETKSAYGEFLKCVNKEEGYLDYFLFKSFLYKIVGENNYKDAQISFFENLRKLDGRKENIKKIGSLIIFISKGTLYQKVESLVEHYSNFYTKSDEKTVKEFINDLIDANTDNCVQAFRENFGYDTIITMNDIYKKIRKRQLLYHIYNNFERVKIKYYHSSPSKRVGPTERLNVSFDMENNVNNINTLNNLKSTNTLNTLNALNSLNNLNTLTSKEENLESKEHKDYKDYKEYKEDICEVYERYSKNQCDFLAYKFTLDAKKLNDEEKILREFIELAFNHLKGEYMRNWLYEDYQREKANENVCI